MQFFDRWRLFFLASAVFSVVATLAAYASSPAYRAGRAYDSIQIGMNLAEANGKITAWGGKPVKKPMLDFVVTHVAGNWWIQLDVDNENLAENARITRKFLIIAESRGECGGFWWIEAQQP